MFVGQFWHPLVSLIERTQSVRGLLGNAEKEKELTNSINAAKKGWEAASRTFLERAPATTPPVPSKAAKRSPKISEEPKFEDQFKKVEVPEPKPRKAETVKPQTAPPAFSAFEDPKMKSLIEERDSLRDAKRNAATSGNLDEANRLNKEINKIQRRIDSLQEKLMKKAKKKAEL